MPSGEKQEGLLDREGLRAIRVRSAVIIGVFIHARANPGVQSTSLRRRNSTQRVSKRTDAAQIECARKPIVRLRVQASDSIQHKTDVCRSQRNLRELELHRASGMRAC